MDMLEDFDCAGLNFGNWEPRFKCCLNRAADKKTIDIIEKKPARILRSSLRASQCCMQGTISKKLKVRGWHPRYFVLFDDLRLVYYLDEHQTEQKGEMDLREYVVFVQDKNSLQVEFIPSDPTTMKTVHLAFQTDFEKNLWLEEIQCLQEAYKHANSPKCTQYPRESNMWTDDPNACSPVLDVFQDSDYLLERCPTRSRSTRDRFSTIQFDLTEKAEGC